jgi:hypothetical protein
MAKQPVTRKAAMYTRKAAMYGGVKGSAGARTHSGFNTKGVAGIGGGNSTSSKRISTSSKRISTEATSISPASQGISGSVELSTANFEEEKSKPRDSEHSSAGSAPESAGSEPSGTLVSAGSALALGRTGNAGRGEVLDQHSLKEALQVLGLTLEEFSVLANTSLDTVKKWSSRKTKTPGIALAMVRLLAQVS